jgi:hypothetical protein
VAALLVVRLAVLLDWPSLLSAVLLGTVMETRGMGAQSKGLARKSASYLLCHSVSNERRHTPRPKPFPPCVVVRGRTDRTRASQSV